MGITEFLLARLAEDEPLPDAGRCTDGREMLYVTRQRRDLEAKRKIVEEHPQDDDGYCYDSTTHSRGCQWLWPCPTLRALASVYADHPDYRDEWEAVSEYTVTQMTCDLFWGSHGCDLPKDHEGTVHVCGTRDPDGVCCEYDVARPADARIRHNFGGVPPEWGEWGPYSDPFRMGTP